MSTAEKAIDRLHRDLAFSKKSSRPDAEAVVMTTQETVSEVLLEIERLRDRCKTPQYYTIPVPNLTKKQRQQAMENSPVPVIPWKDYGKPRHG